MRRKELAFSATCLLGTKLILLVDEFTMLAVIRIYESAARAKAFHPLKQLKALHIPEPLIPFTMTTMKFSDCLLRVTTYLL